MNTIVANTYMENNPYCTKLKEQLRRNRITYYERTEGNFLVIQIRAKNDKDSGHKNMSTLIE